MPKRTKGKATQPPPTKRRSTRSTAATSRSNYTGNAATSETSQPAVGTDTTPTDTSETTPTTTVVAAQHQPFQTQELVSQLSNVIQLLTTSLSGSAPINSTQPQGPPPNEESAEVLSEVSDNPPNTVNPCISTTANLYTPTTEPPFSATQNSPVSLPAVPSRLKDKIISGEFIDFTSLLSRAMFSGTQSVEPSKFITFYLNPEKDDFSVRPTPPPRKISSFLTWMEAWNIYLAILIDHAPARAPQLVAYQRIITSASNQSPLAAWLNYDVRFRTLAASDPSLRWDVRHTDLWLECFSGTHAPTTRWPCVHCGATTHYPENCLFRAQPMSEPRRGQQPPPVSTPPGGHHPPGNIPQRPTMEHPSSQRPRRTCHAFNRSNCRRSPCTFLHLCEICGATHSARLCPNRDSLAF